MYTNFNEKSKGKEYDVSQYDDYDIFEYQGAENPLVIKIPVSDNDQLYTNARIQMFYWTQLYSVTTSPSPNVDFTTFGIFAARQLRITAEQEASVDSNGRFTQTLVTIPAEPTFLYKDSLLNMMFFLLTYKYTYNNDIFVPLQLNKGQTKLSFYLDAIAQPSMTWTTKLIHFDSGTRPPAAIPFIEPFQIPSFSTYSIEIAILYKDKKRRQVIK